MTTKEDVSQNLKPNQIMKNTWDLEKVLRSIQENMNLFREKVNTDLLFSIGTVNHLIRNCRVFVEC